MRRRPHTLVSTRAPSAPSHHRRRGNSRRRSSAEDSLLRHSGVFPACPPSTHLWLAPLASALVGMSAALTIVGLCFRLRNAEIAFDSRAVVAGGLLALALGVSVPQRMALWLCSIAWSAVTRRSDTRLERPPESPSNRTLHWLVVSVIALGAGVGALLLPISSRCGLVVRIWLEHGFVWPTPMNLLLDATVTLAVCVAALFPLGVALCGLHHLGSPVEQWNARATCWTLLGAGLMLSFAPPAALASVSANLLLVAAALPVLTIPLVVAFVGKTEPLATQRSPATAVPPPTERDRRPRLLRSAIVAVGGGGACVVCAWSEDLTAFGGGGNWVWGLAPLALACGMFAGSVWDQLPTRSIAGFGTTTALAGLLTAAGPAMLSLVAIGYAVGYGRGLLWARVANRATAGAAELTRFFLCIALTVVVTCPLANYFFGHRATLQMVALSLIALGGTLVIHDPGHAPRVRHRRVAAIFASLGLMILLALFGNPASGR